jgi:hypothetical protein
MYITNFQHYLNEDGEIPKNMPKEARELANFLALLVDDATTVDYDADPTIRCIKKDCKGLIAAFEDIEKEDEIYWVCPICITEGVITNWKGKLNKLNKHMEEVRKDYQLKESKSLIAASEVILNA